MADFPTLKIGSTGNDVNNLQIELNTWARRLNREDFFTGTPDGVFGSQTDQAVRNVQYALGLTPDGVVGPLTWDAIQTVGAAIASGQVVSLKTPQNATGGAGSVPPSSMTSTVAPSLGFNLSSILGGLDWKLVGMVLAVGFGLVFIIRKSRR